MALALDITADELVFDKTERQPRIDVKELIRNWEKVEILPEEDKQTIKKIVSAVLVKHSVEPPLGEKSRRRETIHDPLTSVCF